MQGRQNASAGDGEGFGGARTKYHYRLAKHRTRRYDGVAVQAGAPLTVKDDGRSRKVERLFGCAGHLPEPGRRGSQAIDGGVIGGNRSATSATINSVSRL